MKLQKLNIIYRMVLLVCLSNIGYAQSPLTNITTGNGTFVSLSSKEDTKGSQLFFTGWAKGEAQKKTGEIIKGDMYEFNYDKINGNLIVSESKREPIAVSQDAVTRFTLYNKGEAPVTFVVVPAIDTRRYSILLTAGKNYQFYKLVKTKFEKANFKTDGITSSGNKYDEFTDEYTYYVVKQGSDKPVKLSLKKKAIKEVFSADIDKVNKFMADNTGDIDEEYVKRLCENLNQ